MSAHGGDIGGVRDIVLVLEDDDDIRSVLSDVLRDAGFSTVSAGHDGSLPQLGGVGLVLTDLPKTLQGYSSGAARDWVASLRDRYLAPVVVITAHGEAAADDGLSALSAAIVMKPFELDQLVAQVNSLAASVSSDGAR